MSAADRLDAYRWIIAQRPDDGHQRGSTVTQEGAHTRYDLWPRLVAAHHAHRLLTRTDDDHDDV